MEVVSFEKVQQHIEILYMITNHCKRCFILSDCTLLQQNNLFIGFGIINALSLWGRKGQIMSNIKHICVHWVVWTTYAVF